MIAVYIFLSCFLVGSLVADEPPIPVRDNKWMNANWPGINPKDAVVVVDKDPVNPQFPDQTTGAIKEIPMNVLERVASIEDADEFLNKFVTYSDKDVLTGKSEEGSKTSIISRSSLDFRKNGGITRNFARQALCTPSPQVVELKKEDDPLVLYFPTCTRVKRCGGCCRSSLLECQPSQVEKKTLQVIRAKYATFRSRPFDYEAIENITVEEHTKCKCQCKVKAEDCNALQTYKRNQCKCECNNQVEAKRCQGSDKFWDSNICACKCKNYQDQCSTGRKFSEKVCRCIPEAIFNHQEDGGSDFLFGRRGSPLRNVRAQ